jgi:hypothetical protein
VDDFGDVPGARDVRDVLRSDPLASVVGTLIERPAVVGTMLFILAVIAIVFGPASDSRFIYTDF